MIVAGSSLAEDEVGSFVFASSGHFAEALGAAIIAVPTVIGAVVLASFGVSVEWGTDVLSHDEGTIAALGAAVGLLPLLGIGTVFGAGWLTAHRSGDEVRVALGNALRAAAVFTAAVWLVGLLVRVDAQAGGLLGFHLAPEPASLLWHVPLISFLGCFAGASAHVLARGALARRQLADTLAGALAPPAAGSRSAWLDPAREGLSRRAGAGVAFAAVPLVALALGSGGSPNSPQPVSISYAPIEKAAEQQLERDSLVPAAVDVTVNSATRALGTAMVQIPVRAVGAKPSAPATEKARAVLAEYGDLFGLSSRPGELGRARAGTDQLGMTHVSFQQFAAGVPVFGSHVSVHLSADGRSVTFLSGSTVPDLDVADTETRLDAAAAINRAKTVLPGSELAGAPTLQVYAGSGPVIAGPEARLAWFVWLLDDARGASNVYVVDAVDGRILKVLDKTTDARNRLVYNANNGTALPRDPGKERGTGGDREHRRRQRLHLLG